tara:strand:+ start:22926 stop:23336 length:411 start_codon:yes stop_codon:yes gene_type:complete
MEIKLFTKDNLIRATLHDAYEMLKRRGFFHVFLSFVDPRTDSLVEDYFCFYPKPQPSYAGGGFIADHNGLVLRIPSDLRWYAEKQETFNGVERNEKVTLLVRGEYVTKPIRIRVQPNIRLFDNEQHTIFESVELKK